jgi:hypothetical protein
MKEKHLKDFPLYLTKNHLVKTFNMFPMSHQTVPIAIRIHTRFSNSMFYKKRKKYNIIHYREMDTQELFMMGN